MQSAVTIYVPYDGVVKKLMYEVGDVATKGKPLLMVEVDGEGEGNVLLFMQNLFDILTQFIIDAQAPPTETTPTPASDTIQTTPAVRRIASENSVDLRDVKGTGKDGRVLKEDVLKHIQSSSPKVAAASEEASSLSSSSGGKVLATPVVRRMASEEGVNLSEVRGTGEGGRVLKEDLLRHIQGIELHNQLMHSIVTTLCRCSDHTHFGHTHCNH